MSDSLFLDYLKREEKVSLASGTSDPVVFLKKIKINFISFKNL
jgi:hypothetical protein